jgi:hypothetical protein
VLRSQKDSIHSKVFFFWRVSTLKVFSGNFVLIGKISAQRIYCEKLKENFVSFAITASGNKLSQLYI